MKYKFFGLILILMIIASGCGVKQPVDPEESLVTGKIFVDSSPANGRIFLDGQCTNKLTPDTLFNVPTGSHLIQVLKSGYHSSPDSVRVRVEPNQTVQVRFTLRPNVNTGFVWIETRPPGGEIFVNNLTSGKYTLDTLKLEAGRYDIEIRKNGYLNHQFGVTVIPDSVQHLSTDLKIQPRVLLEGFSNVSCLFCVDAMQNLHKLVQATDLEQLAIIDYFTNWPSPNDPFNKAAPEDVLERVKFYTISSLPALRIAGATGIDATIYSNLFSAFEKELALTANQPIGISVDRKLIDGILEVTVEIYDYTKPLKEKQLHLFVAIVENKIYFNNPPGSNGLTDFDFVFRGFLTPSTGEPILNDAYSAKFQYSLTWPAWNYRNSQVLAFVQNKITKYIFQVSVK